MKTHEDKHAFGISFPTVDHLFVLFDNPIEIHGEYDSRTIGKVGLSLRDLILRIWIVIYRGCSWCEDEAVVLGLRSKNCSVPRPVSPS